jgi:hypothetical protein
MNDVFVATTGNKELHLVRDMRLNAVVGPERKGQLGDVSTAGNAKFFAVGIPG